MRSARTTRRTDALAGEAVPAHLQNPTGEIHELAQVRRADPIIAGGRAGVIRQRLSVRFLTRYFHTRTLTPFAVYCTVAGAVSLAVLTMR